MVILLALLTFISSAEALDGTKDCFKIFEAKALKLDHQYKREAPRRFSGEITFSNGQTMIFPNDNVTFASDHELSYENRNDPKIAVNFLMSENILSIAGGESYSMISHLKSQLEKKKIIVSITDIQKYIKEGFNDPDSKFCKDDKVHKSAGQIIRYVSRNIKDDFETNKINNSPRTTPKPQLAEDFNKERDVAGKKTKKD